MGEIFIKLSVQFPNDRKVRALARYGADAGLARDLYVQMCLYCKDMLSDGLVPVEQVGLLVYPLDIEHGNQLAKQLASVGLIKEASKDETQCWEVIAYLRRNGTKADVERLSRLRAEAGRAGGTVSRKPPARKPTRANSKQVANQDASNLDPRDRDRDNKEKEHGSLARADVGSDKDPSFAAFWVAYPRAGSANSRPGKGQARAAWRKAVLSDRADPDAVVAAAEKYSKFHSAAATDPRFIPHASTWLNGESYNDEPGTIRERNFDF